MSTFRRSDYPMVKRKTRARAPKGLHIIERDGHWHISGTVTLHDGRAIRVRRSTGLCTATASKAEAEHIKSRIEAEARESVITGKSTSVVFARAALEWLKSKAPKPTDIQNAKKLGTYFGSLRVDQITSADILGYINKDHSNNKPSTIKRYLNTLKAILNYSERIGWIEKGKVPHIEMPRVEPSETNKWLNPSEIKLLYDCAAKHIQPLIAVYATTGCRVSEIIHLEIKDFILAPGRERVMLGVTKNGEQYTKALHPWAGQVLRDYLNKRSKGAAFLTNRGVPYENHGGRYGGHIKKGFATAKKKAAQELRDNNQNDRAEVMEKVTPHWFRHSFASFMLKSGADVKTAMEAGGWKSVQLFIKTYGHLAPNAAEEAVRDLPLDFEAAKSKQASK